MAPQSAEAPHVTEIRCPVGPRKLLMKVRSEGGIERMTDGNLLELSCRDCTQTARRHAVASDRPAPSRVLHRYDVTGALIETVTE